MSPGFAVFIACVAIGVAWAVISCRRTWRQRGHGEAVREAAVLAASLAAYTSVCLWLGYSTGAQCLALVASLVPVALGRKYVSLGDYTGKDDR